jgi:hypothetical protein
MCARRSAAERQLLVRDRRERQAVERRDPVCGDRRAVLRRRVADVALELPASMDLGGTAHVAVARDLREDRSARDRRALGVAVDDRLLLVLERADAEAVDEADGVVASDAAKCCLQCLEVRAVKPAGVDAADAPDDDCRLRGGAEDERVELLAPRLVVLLRVVEARERAAV